MAGFLAAKDGPVVKAIAETIAANPVPTLKSVVDLWVKAPDDIPVGYSNRGGLFFNLLRDDLGVYKDPTPINYEVAYSRGINPGEHIVNLHLYREDISAFNPFEDMRTFDAFKSR